MNNTNSIEFVEKNHMEIPWHDYTGNDSHVIITQASLIEKASVITILL